MVKRYTPSTQLLVVELLLMLLLLLLLSYLHLMTTMRKQNTYQIMCNKFHTHSHTLLRIKSQLSSCQLSRKIEIEIENEVRRKCFFLAKAVLTM